ncbi:MAG: glycosyltransferase [Desulfobacterales bacterium]|nr:glycosyltransferase [Desulfobacterales bacterium]
MNILHLIPSVGPMSFGPGYVALNLIKEQQRLGCSVQIWCLDTSKDVQWASEDSGLSRKNIRSFSYMGPNFLKYSPEMERVAMGHTGEQFDVVHQHGIWTGISRVTNILRKKHGIAPVIAPHGSLESWALKRSNWKKQIARYLYESRNLTNAACLHATSQSELSDFRDFGLLNPIAVIPNGISNKWLNSDGSADNFCNHFKINPHKRILLFMSRITPKKGLFMLLNAINMIIKNFDDWMLVIIGPDEFGHKSEVKSLVKELRMKDVVKFVDPVFNQLKRDAFSAADLFVLPSYSEGAPMVILDSLAAGVPVITTKASPWEDLSTYGCGWWVDISVNEICEALKCAVNLPREHLEEIGRRGKKLVASKYAWSSLAQMTIDLYSWLLGRGKVPEFACLNNLSANQQKKVLKLK